MIWSLQKSGSLPEQQLQLWESLLERRTGILLTQPQHILLQTQVALRMRELDIDSYEDYLDYVQDKQVGVIEWQVLVDRLVVKETTFFRHRPSLNLVKHVLQDRLFNQEAKSTPLGIWSVGCATGEEAYALAALANDCYEAQGLAPYFGVTAIDISLPALAIAREGVYAPRALKLLTQPELESYFEPVGKGSYRVIEKIKRRVCFSQLNVLDLKNKPVQPMDIIFCQNLLIYLRRWRRRKVLNELVSHLKPGGILIIGLGEITDWRHPDMQRIAHEEVQAYVKCS